jgi:hypothetical protein
VESPSFAARNGATRAGRPSRPRALSPAQAAAIAAKREHRQKLSEIALDHWSTAGDVERAAYLARVRAALLAEGYRSTPFQWRHRGHAFGLIKEYGPDKQIHVRVYDNGVIDAEYEIHKRYLQHLYSPRPSAHRVVQRIFTKHGIPTHLVNVHYLPQVGAHRRTYPKRRTKVSSVAVGSAASVVGGWVAVSVARMVLRRWRGRGA